MKKVSLFAFALIFAGAISCDNPSSTEEAAENAVEAVEEAAEETEELAEEVAEDAEEAMDTTMKAGKEAMEETHDHAEGEDHSEM